MSARAFLNTLVPGAQVRVPTRSGVETGTVCTAVVYDDASRGPGPGDSRISVQTTHGCVVYLAKHLTDWSS